VHVLELEDRRAKEEREREARAAIGAARAMRDYLWGTEILFKQSVEADIWWPEEVDAPAPSFDDRKIVLAQLTPKEWVSVGTAFRVIEMTAAMRAVATAGIEGGTEIRSNRRESRSLP
jgi:hypothetical protein